MDELQTEIIKKQSIWEMLFWTRVGILATIAFYEINLKWSLKQYRNKGFPVKTAHKTTGALFLEG